jgi:uncharacterized membrane protein
MTSSTVFWTALLGLGVFVAGLITYRDDVRESTSIGAFGLVALGPVFVAASIAAFAGEHFSAGPVLAQLVPKFMPGRLFIAYLVGVAHLAAALSFVAKRYVRWSSFGLALMFALFVLLMDLPSAIQSPSTRMFWMLTAREGTFSIGALALFAIAIRGDRPAMAKTLGTIARVWTAGVLVVYGIQHFLFPQFSPGVPSTTPTATWVPLPAAIAYATGFLFVVYGLAMLTRKYRAGAAAKCGLVVLVFTVVLYVPQFFVATSVGQRITALNFIFDTLLFAGTLLVVANAIRVTEAAAVVATEIAERRPLTVTV